MGIQSIRCRCRDRDRCRQSFDLFRGRWNLGDKIPSQLINIYFSSSPSEFDYDHDHDNDNEVPTVFHLLLPKPLFSYRPHGSGTSQFQESNVPDAGAPVLTGRNLLCCSGELPGRRWRDDGYPVHSLSLS